MDILLTNDDGINAVGLRALYGALREAGHTVHVVAPMTEQSAVGHAITLFSPLRVTEVREVGFEGIGVVGTPADCVKLAVHHILPKRPDVVVSGINAGANVGVDVLYSGTVSAATEGALAGIWALAVSVDDFRPRDLNPQARCTAAFVADFPWGALPQLTVLNLNFPAGPLPYPPRICVCPQTSATYRDWYLERADPRGRPYYWLGGVIPEELVQPGTDRALLTEGCITLTPLTFDLTHWAFLNVLRDTIPQPENQGGDHAPDHT
jgi:5'-nucleotidase